MGDWVMKTKKYIFILVFVLLAVIYIIRAVLSSNIVKDTLYKEQIEASVNTKGMLIKYEHLHAPDINGVLDAKFASGDRVSKGSQIAVVYNGSIDTSVKTKLEQINKKISVIENSHSENQAFSNDISKLEQEISSELSKIIESGYKKNMSDVALLKYSITALCEHKSTIEGDAPARESTLSQLKQEKADLEAQIGSVESGIYARASGIFSSYIDGLEELVTPFNMNELTPSKFNELHAFDEANIKENKQSDSPYSCKVIDNYRYFIAFETDEETAADISAGSKAKIRFYDISPKASTVSVVSVSPPEEGKVIVICECRNYLEGLLVQRFVNIEFIKKTYSGYKISLSALRTKDNENGVYVLRENIIKFIPVNIVYNEKEILLVESADKKNPLILYDEVIVNSPDLKEGQMVSK